MRKPAAAAGLPPIDSQSMLEYLLGEDSPEEGSRSHSAAESRLGTAGTPTTVPATSPRLELQVDSNVLLKVMGAPSTDAGVNASLKLWKIFGSGFPSTPQGATGWACFPGPFYPNGTNPGCNAGGDCDKAVGGCLFELYGDETEHVNLADSEGGVMKMMVARLAALQPSIFNPDRGKADQAACAQVSKNGGFYGPWVHL